jgi:hypothetical protein
LHTKPLASDDGDTHSYDLLDDPLAFGLQIIVGGGCPESPEQAIYELEQLSVLALEWVDHQSDLFRRINQPPEGVQELRLDVDDDPAVLDDFLPHLRRDCELGAEVSDLLPELINPSLPIRRSDGRLELGPGDIERDERSGDCGDERGKSANEADECLGDHVSHSPGQRFAKFVMSIAMARAISA